MASISKRASGEWQNTSYGIRGTVTDTITTLPKTIYSDGTNATVSIKGNTTQSGTPTPDSPVMPQGCGNKTANLFDYATQAKDLEHHTAKQNFYLNSSGGEQVLTSWWISDYIEINADTVTVCQVGGNTPAICCYDSNKEYIRGQAYMTGGVQVLNNITLDTSGAKYVRFSFYRPVSGDVLMLVEGSTAPSSYIPYGYKIPISSAGQTTPVYLGEVETTRKVEKLVLTGEEAWSSYSGVVYLSNVIDYLKTDAAIAVCTHYQSQTSVESVSETTAGHIAFSKGSNFRLCIRDNNYTSTTNFKTYLQQQYAAGTPVTVWYVLAEPTTSIVNEPLMKIDGYADEVNNISIPTTDGANTLSVDTTVHPSEVSVNYHGWHMGTVHERTSGQWD